MHRQVEWYQNNTEHPAGFLSSFFPSLPSALMDSTSRDISFFLFSLSNNNKKRRKVWTVQLQDSLFCSGGGRRGPPHDTWCERLGSGVCVTRVSPFPNKVNKSRPCYLTFGKSSCPAWLPGLGWSCWKCDSIMGLSLTLPPSERPMGGLSLYVLRRLSWNT